jgi:hypothetical protein
LVIALLFATVGPSSTVLATATLKPRKSTAILLGVLFTYLMIAGAYEAKEFIYFQF